MSSIAHTTTGQAREAASTSETAIGGEAGGNIVPKDTETTAKAGQDAPSGPIDSSEPGSAEAAAEKLFEERMEDEYAKREGGA